MKKALVFVPLIVGLLASTCFANIENALFQLLIPKARILHSDLYGGGKLRTEKQVQVFSNHRMYRYALSHYSWAPEKVDFSNNQILLIRAGLKRSAGFGVEVTGFSIEADRAFVDITYVRPGSSCPTAAVLSNPMALVQIPTRKQILIREHLEISECEY